MSDRYDSYDAALDRDLDAEAAAAEEPAFDLDQLSPELREEIELAQSRAAADGYLVPDEADEPEAAHGDYQEGGWPKVVDGAPVCFYCGDAISSTRNAYRRVVAWERKRRAGGTNAVRLREPLDEYACARCVDAVAAGRDPGQRAML